MSSASEPRGREPETIEREILMPLEASGVIGAVSGLTEIARQAFGDGDGGGKAAGGSVPKSGKD